MALPDITNLSEAELEELARAASQRLDSMRNSEANNRAQLLEPTTISNQIAWLENASAELSLIISGMQGASDAKTHLQITRRLVNNMVRILRVTGNRLDSASVGQ